MMRFEQLEGSKAELIEQLLGETRFQDTANIAWHVFTKSMQKQDDNGSAKPVLQGCQRTLKRLVNKKKIIRKRAIAFSGWDDAHRYVYALPKTTWGDETGHTLVINKMRMAIQLLSRCKTKCKVDRIEVAYRYIRFEGNTVPRTTIEIQHCAIIPDMVALLEQPKNQRIVWLCEADNGTETIVRPKGDKNPDSSLMGKVERYHELRSDPQNYAFFETQKKLSAIQVLFLFPTESRMNHFRRVCRESFDVDLSFIWTATRQSIENPIHFWTEKIWWHIEEDSTPFAIFENDRMHSDPL